VFLLEVQNVTKLASPVNPPVIDPEGTTADDDDDDALHRKKFITETN
jgi:hypothetical protein